MKYPAASSLNCLITIQTSAKSTDGYNTVTWNDTGKKWGRIETGNPSDEELSGRMAGEVTHTITFRYTESITADHRLMYRGQVFQIQGKPVNEDMANVLTKVYVKEITNG